MFYHMYYAYFFVTLTSCANTTAVPNFGSVFTVVEMASTGTSNHVSGVASDDFRTCSNPLFTVHLWFKVLSKLFSLSGLTLMVV